MTIIFFRKGGHWQTFRLVISLTFHDCKSVLISHLFPVQQPRLIWTLRALQNEDILHQIFNHFGLWPGSRTAVQTRKDLLAAGKTCKVFLKPALNALWSVLPSLLPLLLLLPSAEVVDNEYVSQRYLHIDPTALFVSYSLLINFPSVFGRDLRFMHLVSERCT